MKSPKLNIKREITDLDRSFYYKGYREGFEASLMLVLSLADKLKMDVDANNQQKVQDFINKLQM